MSKFVMLGACAVIVAALAFAAVDKSSTSRPLTTATTIDETTSAPAQSADSFVDALGVDTHFGYDDTVYRYLTTPAPSGNTIVSALKTLGIRRIRAPSLPTAPTSMHLPVPKPIPPHSERS
jgi:hypothetical protein